MAKLSCKKWAKMRDKEAGGGFWPQTQRGPSTMLKRGPKYCTLQLMAGPKTVCKNAQNAM